MESLDKLKRGFIRTENCDLNQDMITNLNWQDLTEWCKTIIRLDENIKETSISRNHVTERRREALKIIINQ